MRLILTLLILTTGGYARAQDRLEHALQTLRDRVVFAEPLMDDTLTRYGLISAGLAVPWAIGIGVDLFVPRGWRHLSRAEWRRFAPPLAAAGAGALTAVVGVVRRSHARPPFRAVKPADHYQSVDGLNDFMQLSPEQQRAVARGNHELAEFLINLADAYELVAGHRYDLEGRRFTRGATAPVRRSRGTP